ncbi:MAG: hypothetical protein MJ007_05225 [Paludibacteraceae bacterium]|nr:hypothetical protein [Paludibacteraceae bacterium]
MTVTIVTNHRVVRLTGVLSIERETYFDARYNEYETTYYITTRPYEYMYYTTISEQIKEVIIEE